MKGVAHEIRTKLQGYDAMPCDAHLGSPDG
jgi:hypothetical protein